ncbi:MAG: 50S ribosomal protein L32 [Patescibacteria group bacterium]
MPLPSFRSSRSKVRRRRSHHALKQIAVMLCVKCSAPVLQHRACKACGAYGDRSVKATGMQEVAKTLDKKVKKAKKATVVAEAETETKS